MSIANLSTSQRLCGQKKNEVNLRLIHEHRESLCVSAVKKRAPRITHPYQLSLISSNPYAPSRYRT
jgi:hypothetical protein